MSKFSVAVPLFPNPPEQYDKRYMADMQRALAQFAQAILSPGEGRNTTIVLTALQDDDYLLENGTLYRNGNDLKITVRNVAAIRGASMTAHAGDVETTP